LTATVYLENANHFRKNSKILTASDWLTGGCLTKQKSFDNGKSPATMFCKRAVGRLPCLTQRAFLSQSRAPFRRENRLVRAEPRFTTNPYAQSVLEASRQARQIGKAVGIVAISTTAAVVIGWQGYHIYIEHFLHPTPPELKHKARNLLHGAYVREEVQPQLEIATLYVQEALRITLEEQKMDEDSDVALALRRRLADDHNRAGNLLDSIAEYSRFWKLMINRLVQKEEESNPEKVLELIDVSKRIGDLYVRIGDYNEAEESLAWAVHTLKSSKADLTTMKDFRKLETLTTLSLANLYAVQRNFDLALPLYLQSLKASNHAAQEDPETFVCLTAIIQCQLSETLYGLHRQEEALGWAQTALETAKKGITEEDGGVVSDKTQSLKDCQECAGVTLNNLGKMLEVNRNRIFRATVENDFRSLTMLRLAS
jgi:tetratricopeptide (TPR) repeat protein